MSSCRAKGYTEMLFFFSSYNILLQFDIGSGKTKELTKFSAEINDLGN